MAKTTFPVTEAFLQGKSKKIKNDSTDGINLYFHGNKIAWKEIEEPKFRIDKPVEHLYISNCSYNTKSTKERLNSIPGIWISQKNYIWYITTDEWKTEKEWDGSPYKVY